jgi:hypothetical protein
MSLNSAVRGHRFGSNYTKEVKDSDRNAPPAGAGIDSRRQTMISRLEQGSLVTVFGGSGYDEIFARLAAEHFDAVNVPGVPFNMQNQTRICQLALHHRIPAVSEYDGWAKCGFLLTYGQDPSWSFARAMDYVEEILRGAKPSDMPVEQATKFDLVVNLKTAKTLGVTVPRSLIARADELIE